MAGASWIDVLEAAYDVEAAERTWLAGILRAAEPMFGGPGLVAYVYDVSRADRVLVPTIAQSRGLRAMTAEFFAEGIRSMGPSYVRATYRSLQVETASHTPGFEELIEPKLRSMGLSDILGINGLDPSGTGVWLGVGLAKRTTVSDRARTRCEKIAAHLSVAHRLRRAIGKARLPRRSPWGAEAVLTARGAVAHCASDEVQRARAQLRSAAIAIDRARGKLRRDADSALAGWPGLVDGRWSLVDKFDTDGKHYVLARRNEPVAPGLGALTGRERAVALYAAAGHRNKLIAYDLGIAHSTVRVLLARAASKLGVRSRDELVGAVRKAMDDDTRLEKPRKS